MPTGSPPLSIAVHHGTWTVSAPWDNLAYRASLPGAHGYDAAAHEFRAVRAKGVECIELLACALPCSWMVNSQASSRTFQAWLGMRSAWGELFTLLPEHAEVWAAASSEGTATEGPVVDRGAIAAQVNLLTRVTGGSLVALSKVLALPAT